MTIHTTYWRPAFQDGIRHSVATYQLVPGDIVVWKRTPWRVTAIRALPFAEWPTAYLDRWLVAGEPDRDLVQASVRLRPGTSAGTRQREEAARRSLDVPGVDGAAAALRAVLAVPGDPAMPLLDPRPVRPGAN